MPNYEKWLIEELRALPDDRRELPTIKNPLVYEWKRRHIADRERLLSQLNPQERIVIERTMINGEKAAALTAETGLTVGQIQSIRAAAIEKLLTLRHGAGHRP